MSELTAQRCEPCEGGVRPMGREEADRMMGQLHEDWSLTEDGLEIHRDFHLNANPADDPALVATSVTGVLGSVRNVRYPRGEPGPQGAPVYSGRVRIEGEIEHRGGGAAAVELAYQACDERRCLPPVTRLVRLR